MSIVFFEIEDIESGILLNLYGDIDYDTVPDALTADNADRYAAAEIISSFIYSDLSAAVLKKLPNLKLIATRSRGFDHIDLDYCNQKSIAVSNVPAYGEHTVAEHVFALLLALSRRIPQAVQQTRQSDFKAQGLQGFDLYGKTMGIIGTGVIGLYTAEIAHAFGMKVLGYDIRPRPAAAEKSGLVYMSLQQLLLQSDILSLHVGNTPESHHILSEKEFSLMKDGVTIINTAIGSAIDIKALLHGLATGRVHAAGLDVLPDEIAIHEEAEFFRDGFSAQHDVETLLASHALLHHKNVIVTPHVAFYTKETVEEILRSTGNNIQSFQAGKPLNLINDPFVAKDGRRTAVLI
jgi:D-lactate dehydrogenase